MKKWKFETRAIKSIEDEKMDHQPVAPPIYLSTTYHRQEDGGYKNGYIYSRLDNPNRAHLEQSLAHLENGASCFAFSSGMAAISAVLQSLKTGDHILLPDDIYYAVYALVEDVFKRWGLQYTMVDMTDLTKVKEAIQPNTVLIWIETPSNPQLKISDIEALCKIGKDEQMLVAVDNTWPTAVFQKPLDIGADVVIHSTTKYIGGHSDVLGGCVILRSTGPLEESIRQIQYLNGAVPSPFDCYLLTRGIQSFHLRVTAQATSAQKLAEFLESHPQIEQVNYPGLSSHPQHEIAKKQMINGFGGMLSVLVKGGPEEARRVSIALELFKTATSLGGVESLVEHRKSVEGPNSQTPENLLRISIGLENVNDLIEDWRRVLENE